MTLHPPVNSTWGSWTLNPTNACLESNKLFYQIPVDGMTNSASILDWIFQINEKTWATAADVGDLVAAIQDIIGRGVCGSGIDSEIDPKPRLKSKYGITI